MASTRPIVKVAAVQAAPVSFDLEKSLEKLSKLTAEAAAAGADLVVFPQVARFTAPRFYLTAKLIPTAAERLVWGRGSGDGLQVQQTDIGKVGSLICWENYMPAARMALYQQGIEIYVAPNADDLPAWTASMQHIAKEGRCFVVSVNSVCKVSDFPSDYPPFTAEHPDRRPDGGQWEPEDIVNHGGSCIVGPLGTMLAEPVWDKEEIVYADLRMADITESRLDFDPVGSYSRPDVFSLTVNTKAGINVAFSS
ncbi:Bifunctional nitrilase/nitrile hydratase NIT4 [Colletotrichum sp. SAR 10_65]|nr:Bifunctional nitrilase/nitrile hydratase NIT4 [Colletotrichum sp. SAR 10_75]KAI8207374.1 Bifunctional nitrilase/nitrile hydratase NIT4 [Colletotrichum sp. SAR 10_65]KAJ5003676.1 Bifunctional nitrilase/nitrile hydratase NIT4 [Colletotrichum sp. SAR 10_66]